MTIKTVLLAASIALTPLAAQAQWKEYVQIDRITGEQIRMGMFSPAAIAEQPRPLLFNAAARGMLLMLCKRVAVFIFVSESGIDGVKYEIEFSELDELPIRARVDSRVSEFRAENWRSDETSSLAFHGTDTGSLYSTIVNSGKLLLEIPTVEYGDLYFSFDLAGTRDLHDRVCGAE